MSFLRRLLGGKPPPQGPPGDDGADRGGRPSTGRPPKARAASRTPTLADLSPKPLHSYFEYVGGGSSKFYAVSLEEEDGDTWRVRFTFGRIGFPRAWSTRVEGAPWRKAANTYMALIDEKTGKGYQIKAWPADLRLPDGTTVDADGDGAGQGPDEVLFQAPKRGALPPAAGGTIAGIALPKGSLYAPEPSGGSRGENPVIWASDRPLADVGTVWSHLAAAFPETGVWPVIIDASHGFSGFDGYLMDVPRGRHTEVLAILRRGWNDSVPVDEEDDAGEEIAPFGKTFPGLAEPTPGERPRAIDHLVDSLGGHLGLVAVHRPADVLDAIGWMGAANNDGDPLDMTTVLRSWELRFDAYLIGLTTDTLTLAVGRPPRDLDAATSIAAEHLAWCPDNIQQGAGSIRDYAPLLVNEPLWPFWWD